MSSLVRTHRFTGWRRLVVLAASADCVVLLGHALIHLDQEALGLAVVFAVGIGLLRRGGGLLGLLVLGGLFADMLFFMFPAANSNASFRSGLVPVFEPAVLTALSLAGLVGMAAAIWTRHTPEAGERQAFGTGLFILCFVVAGFAFTWLIAPLRPPAVPAGSVQVVAQSVAYHPSSLVAAGGKVRVAMTNRDLFWHTFTIDRLRVDVTVPVGSTRSIEFDAQPGTYEFACRVPGHTAAGMRGTLTVR
jgi:plastocyanin